MKKEPRKNNKKVKAILCGASILSVVAVSGIFAYLTDSDTATNKFSIGQVKIELQEPTWDAKTDTDGDGIPDEAEQMAPNATIEKDPQVKNIGKNDAYIYLKVTVPIKSVITANDDGTLVNGGVAQDTELFTYTKNADWTEITSARTDNKKDGTDEIESRTYVYYYKEAVAPNATTTTLFDSVKFANVIEGQIDLSEHQIDIEAYAIQSDGLPENTTIAGAYNIYLNQNS